MKKLLTLGWALVGGALVLVGSCHLAAETHREQDQVPAITAPSPFPGCWDYDAPACLDACP